MSQSIAVSYLDTLLAGQALPTAAGNWLNGVRAQALERANALSVPSIREEEWRYTDLSPLTQARFHRAEAPGTLDQSVLAALLAPEPGCRIAFVDGHFVPSLSTGLTSGAVTVTRLNGDEQQPAVREHLTRLAPFDNDPFVALNTAWLRDGVLIHIGRDQIVAAPIHLLFISTAADAVSHPRVLVVAERGAQCTVVEDFIGTTPHPYLVNAVTEIAIGDAARVEHARLQREGLGAFHIGTCAVSMARDARYTATSVALGARISRHNLTVTQTGEGAESHIDGLALIGERQVADTHSLLDHTVPNGRSRQLHKCIVDGSARAVFNGKIFVRPGAQRTDSGQQSRSLLLSPRARVDAKPQLEIFADDVKCAHGAAIGQLDADQVFYLKSRGLDETRARNLLTYAFAAEIIARVPVPSLVRRLEDVVLQQTQKQTSDRTSQ